MYVAGVLFTVIGLFLLFIAYRDRPGGAPALARTGDNYPLARMNMVMPTLLNAALIIAGAQIVIFYVTMDLGDKVSLLDLGGFLFLLASYGISTSLRIRFRRMRPSAAS